MKDLMSPFFRKSLCSVAGVVAAALMSANAHAVDVYALDMLGTPNLIRFPVASPGTITPIGPSPQSFVLDFDTPGNTLYAVSNGTDAFGTISTTTGAFSPIAVLTGKDVGHTNTGLRIDPTTETFYFASGAGGGSSTLYTLNPVTGVLTRIATIAGAQLVIDIAIDITGKMYGTDSLTDSLYSINKATAVATLIGPLGININNAQGMDFDYSTNTLYAMLLSGFSSQFASINTTTGAATALAAFPNEYEMAVRAPALVATNQCGTGGGFSFPGAGTSGPANIYPDTALIAGAPGTIADLNVTINSFSHSKVDDVDILLVAPSGQSVLLMSDAGGNNFSSATFTIDDAGSSQIPDNGPLVAGTFRPSNYLGNDGINESFTPPAPAPPFGATLSSLNGLNPNGSWKLFIFDDETGGTGSIDTPWCLQVVSGPCVVNCPANINLDTPLGTCGMNITYTPPASLPCGVITCLPGSGSFFPIGTTIVTCSSVAGPSCTFTVKVNDTEFPHLNCPPVTLDNDPGLCSAFVVYAPGATDNCQATLGPVTCIPASPQNFPVGQTVVNCSVTDGSGNTTTCTRTYTVVDVEPPVITCPIGPIKVLSSSGICTAVVNYTVTATDNCNVPPPTISCTVPSGSVFTVGTTHVTCTATDHAVPVPNSSSCGFDVIVICAKRVSGSEKGSVLILSDVEVKWDGTGAVTQDTFIQLLNDNNVGVDVQMFLINGDEPLAQQPPLPAVATERAHPGCNNVDNGFHLTADQPTYWSVLRGAPGTGGMSPWTVLDPGGPTTQGRPDLDPGAAPGSRYLRGYIIAFAVNSANEQIKWNHLAGNATVVNYALGTAFEYNAWAAQAVDPNLATGAVVGTPGIIKFNNFEYAQGFDQLLMNFQAVNATAFSGPKQVLSNTDLTLHLLSHDLRENNTGPKTTKAKFDVWNQNELKFSNAERCITCWYQALLGTWAPLANHFIRANLQTNVGKARIDGLFSPVVCGPNPAPPAPQNNGAFSLLGIITSRLVYDAGVATAETGTNLDGLGYEDAEIRYDVLGGSPPPANPQDETPATNEDENHHRARHGTTVKPN